MADCFGTLFARQTAARLDVDGEIDLHITNWFGRKRACCCCLFVWDYETFAFHGGHEDDDRTFAGRYRRVHLVNHFDATRVYRVDRRDFSHQTSVHHARL